MTAPSDPAAMAAAEIIDRVTVDGQNDDAARDIFRHQTQAIIEKHYAPIIAERDTLRTERDRLRELTEHADDLLAWATTCFQNEEWHKSQREWYAKYNPTVAALAQEGEGEDAG